MKKILSITGLMLTALSLIQCADDNIDKIGIELTSQPQLHVEYTPMTDGSRTTTNPDGTVEWDAQDQLNVFVVEHGKQPQQITDWQKYSYKYITDSKNCKEGIFTPDPSMKQPTFYQGYSYDWYVLSPYNSNVKDPIGGVDSQTSFEIGDQIQEYDQPMKHIVKSDILTAITTNVMAGENPSLHLHHKGTLMKFTIQNCENEPITLRNIKFKAPANVCIAGKFSIDFKEKGILNAVEKKDSVVLTIKNAKPLEVGDSYDAYIIMPPFNLKGGDSFSIDVVSDLGTMHQSLTIQDNIFFLPNQLNTAIINIKNTIPNNKKIIIPDKNFENYLLDNFDLNGDGSIYPDEADKILKIYVNNKNIKSLKGIEFLRELQNINCSTNQIEELDLSKNRNLININCTLNKIHSLNISGCLSLETLDCSSNELKSINIKEQKLCLKKFFCRNNKFKELDISNNYNLSEFDCRNNENLQHIYVWDGFNVENSGPYHYFYKDNQTKYVWIKDNSKEVYIPDSMFKTYLLEKHDINKDGKLSETEVNIVQSINCNERDIKSLSGIEYFVNLTKLNCENNKLTSLDISNNIKLTSLSCNNNNKLKELDISKNNLKEMKCFGSPKLKFIYVANNFNEEEHIHFEKDGETLYIPKNIELDFGGETISIPEEPFRNYLLSHYDFNEDNHLTTGECKLIKYIKINPTSYCFNPTPEIEIHTAEGLKYMINLEHLDFTGTSRLQCGHVEDASSGGLTTLDISNNKKLKYLSCKYNKELTSVYVWSNFSINNFETFNIEKANIIYK